tara:strand:- start:156 stop:647 length:492 start_codon:yes stop_codon:yes gene_type:complete
MKKNFSIIFLFLLLSCSNFDFVYNSSSDLKELKEEVVVLVVGDDMELIKNYLLKKVGTGGENPRYLLKIESQKNIDASIINKDATASKFTIKHTLNYNFFNNDSGCLILNKVITTQSSYDAKSAGYSFGTDLSAKHTNSKDIESNIDKFIQEINSLQNNLSCK